MSGHSKWHSIRHKKAAVDAKRGKLFTKLIKEITIAAKLGGGNIENNPRLKTAVEAAKAANMPKENIERAIKRGTGELPGTNYEEIVYEGYGPGGVAIMVEVTTDNRNRSAAEIRHIFSKYGGSLGETGCVAWMFEKKGVIFIPKDAADEDTIMEIALEAGAEDIKTEDENNYEIITSPEDLMTVKDAFTQKNIKVENASIIQIPKNTVKLDEEMAAKVLKLMNALEDNDDVNRVSANFDIPDEIMEKLS